MAVLGYLPKLKRDVGLAFGAHVQDHLSMKNVPYLTLYQLTKFNVVSFFLLKISNKMHY